MAKRKADDSDSDSDVVDLTESPEDIKPVIIAPYVHEVDDETPPAIVVQRRGLILTSALPWVYATRRLLCMGSSASFSKVVLLAQRFGRFRGSGGRLLLAESEAFAPGATSQFALGGAAVERGNALARELDLEVTVGSVVLPAVDGALEIAVGPDGAVEYYREKAPVALGTLGAGAKLRLWIRDAGCRVAMSLHPSALQYSHVDGETLLEAYPPSRDLARGPAL